MLDPRIDDLFEKVRELENNMKDLCEIMYHVTRAIGFTVKNLPSQEEKGHV